MQDLTHSRLSNIGIASFTPLSNKSLEFIFKLLSIPKKPQADIFIINYKYKNDPTEYLIILIITGIILKDTVSAENLIFSMS